MECGDVEHRSDDGAPAANCSTAAALAAVTCVVQVLRGPRLSSIQSAEFWKFRDERHRNDRANARDGPQPAVDCGQFDCPPLAERSPTLERVALANQFTVGRDRDRLYMIPSLSSPS